jgi:hypothetical protein
MRMISAQKKTECMSGSNMKVNFPIAFSELPVAV